MMQRNQSDKFQFIGLFGSFGYFRVVVKMWSNLGDTKKQDFVKCLKTNNLQSLVVPRAGALMSVCKLLIISKIRILNLRLLKLY